MPVRFLWSFHYFRSFAIINIVMAHIWRYPSDPGDPLNTIEIIREVLFHNSTYYFIFISGFLFHHISKKMDKKSYYIKKLKFVIAPYLITSIIVLCLFYLLESLNFYRYPVIDQNPLILLLKGAVTPHLWYIPFIAIVFFISPYLLMIPEKTFVKITILVLLIPLLGTRTGTEITLGQYLYFVPGYILGMATSIWYDTVLAFLKKHIAFAIFLTFLCTIALFFIYKLNLVVSYANITEALFYIQKISIIASVLPVFNQISNKKYHILDVVARMSFAIYFIHYVIGRLNQPFFFKFLVAYVPESFWGIATFLFPFLIIFECMLVIRLVKLLFGRKSRMLIGY